MAVPIRKLRKAFDHGKPRDSTEIIQASAEKLIAKHDEKIVRILAKREAGQTLTRRERILLAAEEEGMTPEHQMKVLKRVSDAPGRNSLASVNAVNAAAALCGDRDGEIEGTGKGSVNVSVGAIWNILASNPEGNGESKALPPLGFTVSPVPLDSEPESVLSASAGVDELGETDRDSASGSRRPAGSGKRKGRRSGNGA